LRVVRLSKVKAGERCPENWKRQKKRIEREVVFANHAFGPIIGLEFVGSVRPVQLSSSVIQELNESISGIRPGKFDNVHYGIKSLRKSLMF